MRNDNTAPRHMEEATIKIPQENLNIPCDVIFGEKYMKLLKLRSC